MQLATTDLATSVATEIVLLTANQQEELDGIVRRFHRALAERLDDWQLTIADQGSSDDTFNRAQRLSAELANVRTIQLPGRLDRRALRRRWAAGVGATVAFVELGIDTDIDRILAPLERTTVVSDRAPLK